MDEKEAEARPVMGTIFLVYIAMLSVCRMLYVVCLSYVICCMSVVCQINCIGGITWPTRMLKVFWGRLNQ